MSSQVIHQVSEQRSRNMPALADGIKTNKSDTISKGFIVFRSVIWV